MPTLTTAEYASRKAAYTAEHGHTITIPGLFDIIKIRTEEPMTALENYWWNHGEHERFSPARLEVVRRQKAARRARFLAMLASPTPAVAQNAGSIMCAIDDSQDAVSTLACIAQLGRKVAPRMLGKLLRGPTGLLLIASDFLNMVQQSAQFCMMPMYGKKDAERLARGSPRPLKMKLKKRMWSTARIPTKSDWIQGLQTTDQVFGFGICLGPIVGLAQDIFYASVRARPGVFVDVRLPIPDVQEWVRTARRVVKSASALFSALWTTDDDDILMWTAAVNLGFQTLMPQQQAWNPLEQLDEIENLQIQAPIPWHTLTLEVIREGPVPLSQCIGWPQTNQRWSTIRDIMEITQENTVINMRAFYQRNNHSFRGWMAGAVANDASGYALGCLEGVADVDATFDAAYIAAQTMIAAGIRLDPNQPMEKFMLFNTFLEDCSETHYSPTIQAIMDFCASPWNDIRLLQQT